MTRTVFAPPIAPEFDPFLCAFIGVEPNGTMLSVLSAFARTEIDPWKEAAQLARMSREAATLRLTEFILKLPNPPRVNKPAKTIASELVALLPTSSAVSSPLPIRLPTTLSGASTRMGTSLAVVLLLAGFAVLYWVNFVPRPATPPAAPSEKATTLTPRELGR
jgi:hypothetical protein